ADRIGQWVQPCAGASGENDSLSVHFASSSGAAQGLPVPAFGRVNGPVREDFPRARVRAPTHDAVAREGIIAHRRRNATPAAAFQGAPAGLFCRPETHPSRRSDNVAERRWAKKLAVVSILVIL